MITTNTDRYGPQGEHVAALLNAIRAMTPEQADAVEEALWDAMWWPGTAPPAKWVASWDAAQAASWNAKPPRLVARSAAWVAAWDAAPDVARGAARNAAVALVVRDVLDREHYDELTHAVRSAGITVHPDDPKVPA